MINLGVKISQKIAIVCIMEAELSIFHPKVNSF